MAKTNETYAQRHYESALDYFEQGNYEKALQQIDNAIQQTPDNPDYLSTKGIFLHRMNDVMRAVDSYQRAIKVDPNHSFSHYNLGLIFMKEGKVLQAIQQWEAVLKTKPNDIDSNFNIAVALTQLGKTKQAIPFYKKILELDPSHVQTHQNLGVIYRDEHEFGLAKEHFIKLRDLDSTFSEIVQNEIFKCEEQEFLSMLEDDKKKTASFIGLADNSDLAKALSAIVTENFDTALDYANIVLDKTPDDKSALLVKGQALAALWKTDEAIATFEKAIELNVDDAESHFQLGSICLSAGKYTKALECFKEVFRIDPSFPLVNENLEAIKKKIESSQDE